MTIATGQQALAADMTITLIPAASDVLKNSNDTERTTTQTSYTKIKEVKVNEAYTGVMRIKFDLSRVGGSDYVRGKIYKNGAPIGTERSIGILGYQTFSEDLAVSLVANDLLQIYGYRVGAGASCYIRNFQFYYSDKVLNFFNGQYRNLETEILFDKLAISVTNQDPA